MDSNTPQATPAQPDWLVDISLDDDGILTVKMDLHKLQRMETVAYNPLKRSDPKSAYFMYLGGTFQGLARIKEGIYLVPTFISYSKEPREAQPGDKQVAILSRLVS